jgi:hypothetical protein
MKMKVTNLSVATQAVAYWNHASANEPNAACRGAGAPLGPLVAPSTAEQIVAVDLAQTGSIFPYAGCPAVPFTAESAVRGLRIVPVDPSNVDVELDWVRLTASNGQSGAAMMTVNLNGCSSFTSLTVRDAANTPFVITDSTGNNSQRTFNYGIFPPGAYTISATCGGVTGPAAAFQVNAAPLVTVIDPDETGDPATDYAFLTRGGDRWDFDQVTDVLRTQNVSTTAGACAGGGCGVVPTQKPGAAGAMLRASSIGEVGDPMLTFLDRARVPLSGRRHRFLTFSLRNNRPYVLNAAIGPVFRVFWSSSVELTVSQDMKIWPGFHTYTLDLSALTVANGGLESGLPNQIPWTAQGIRFFRLDPHEYNDAATSFDFDDVTLAAPDEVTHGDSFAVRYRFVDPDGDASSSYRARIWLAAWPNRSGQVLIGDVPGVGNQQNLTFSFNPLAAQVPAGEYTVSVEIVETRPGMTQSSIGYSSGPLVVVNPAASTPRVSISYPPANATVPVPFTLDGCAFDDGTATGSVNVDDIVVNAVAGTGVVGVLPGTVYGLGYGSPLGTLQFVGRGTPVVCASQAPTSPYRNSGFRIPNVSLPEGPWTIQAYALMSLTGQVVQLPDIAINVGNQPQAPANFQASAAANTVTVSFQASPGAVAGYDIEVATNASFSPLYYAVTVPSAGTYSGQLPSGRFYLRGRTRMQSGAVSPPTAAVVVDVAPPPSPGVPVLTATQVASNPVTLSWTAGPGGAPTSFTLYAGTTPQGSNLAVAPMGLATSISTVAPAGVPIYVRVVATNAAGSATSNEIVFTLAAPRPPTLLPASVSGSNVTLRWTPPAGGSPPSSYVVYARVPGSPAIIASLPVGGTTATVPAPRGTYVVTVVAVNGQGVSGESNQITVIVP